MRNIRIVGSRYYLLLMASLVLVGASQNVFAGIDDEIKTVDDIVKMYWKYSDIRERAKSTLNSSLVAIDDQGNLAPQLPKLFRVTYCYYIEEISRSRDKAFELCPIVDPDKKSTEEELLVHYKRLFRAEVLKITGAQYREDIAVVTRKMPLPKEKLGDKALRLIPVSSLSREKPFSEKVENGVLTISVMHLLAKNRFKARDSHISKEPDRFRFDLHADLNKAILDLRGVSAADLPSAMYIIAQLIRGPDSTWLKLVEYKPSEASSNTTNRIYAAFFFPKDFRIRTSEKLGPKASFEEHHYVANDLRYLTEIPLEILVDKDTAGYTELIPKILTAVGSGVTVYGETAGIITAELAMGDGVTGVKGSELIFSAGELLVTDGKELFPSRFKKFEGGEK